MTGRTAHKTVTFSQPFTLGGVDGLLAPGVYDVDTDEETIENLSFLAWRRVATTIRVHRNGVTETHRIDPVELDATLLRDAGRTVRPTE
jgi:hypothetical protein